MKIERVAIYIDGSNTYNRLREIALPEQGAYFDFSAFTTHLTGNRTLVSKRYYIGVVRNHDNSERALMMVCKQQKFLAGLRNEGFEVKQGRIMYDTGAIREKGVDVKLSLDMAVGAADNLYDTAIVVSSDTDLIPAIKYMRSGKKKSVEYVGFGTRPSFGMIKESTTARILARPDLAQFQNKVLKFRQPLADLILQGKKTTTWRLFDEKNLQTGDALIFKVWETKKEFARAVIREVAERTLGTLQKQDYAGHEEYDDEKGMIEQFRKYYGNTINKDTRVKIIRFLLKKKNV